MSGTGLIVAVIQVVALLVGVLVAVAALVGCMQWYW